VTKVSSDIFRKTEFSISLLKGYRFSCPQQMINKCVFSKTAFSNERSSNFESIALAL